MMLYMVLNIFPLQQKILVNISGVFVSHVKLLLSSIQKKPQ